MIGIYKITNKNNGKVYIGQSNNIERRLAEHKKEHSVNIDDYIQILGVENFDFEVLEECSLEEIDKKEQEYIKKYNSCEKGYNHQIGGMNNSVGEGNGRALVAEEQIKFIRSCYAKHCQPKEIFNEYFKDILSLSQFQSIWQGRSWAYIMPEVYTEENKNFYKTGAKVKELAVTPSELFEYRKYYVTHSAKQVYEKFLSDHKDNQNIGLSERSFSRVLQGDVRESSVYNTVPLYKKSLKSWELNGKPLQTIPESWE